MLNKIHQAVFLDSNILKLVPYWEAEVFSMAIFNQPVTHCLRF